MTKRVIGSVFFGIWLGCFTAAAQLPPDVMVDKYLLEAKMLSDEKDHKGALEAMDRILALQKEHDLTLPEAFPFQYAQTALAAGSVQAAIESVNRYLSAAGREGKHYREALELLLKAERSLRESAPDPVGTGTAKPDIGQQSQAVSPSPPAAEGTSKVQPVVDCRQWSTEEYFKTATVERVTTCLAAGADPMARGEWQKTPLHHAARHNENAAVIKALLRAGANPKARDDNRLTPLHYAAARIENPAVIEALLKGGADPKARDNVWGNTPLHWVASNNENPDVAKALLVAGGDQKKQLKQRNGDGWMPLHLAAGQNQNPEVIELLLNAGADLNATDKTFARTHISSKWMPLHVAARSNENPAVIETLLRAGADPVARDDEKNTPLHLAAKDNKNPAVIEALLAAGADLAAVNKAGRTPLSLANEHNKNPSVRQALLAAGAERVEKQMADARKRQKASSGPSFLDFAIGTAAGVAIAAAGGGTEEAVEAGTVFAEGAISGQSPVGSSGVGVSTASANPGGSSGDFAEALGNLENSCGERFRSAFSEQNHGRFYCLDAFARHCALKKGHNQQQLDALRHDFEVLRSQGQESGCPYFGVFGVTYAPGFEREAIDRAEKETRKAQEEEQRRLDEQARQTDQKGKRLKEENNARVLASDCDCISKDERDGELACLDGFVGLTESLCNVRFRRR